MLNAGGLKLLDTMSGGLKLLDTRLAVVRHWGSEVVRHFFGGSIVVRQKLEFSRHILKGVEVVIHKGQMFYILFSRGLTLQFKQSAKVFLVLKSQCSMAM